MRGTSLILVKVRVPSPNNPGEEKGRVDCVDHRKLKRGGIFSAQIRRTLVSLMGLMQGAPHIRFEKRELASRAVRKGQTKDMNS